MSGIRGGLTVLPSQASQGLVRGPRTARIAPATSLRRRDNSTGTERSMCLSVLTTFVRSRDGGQRTELGGLRAALAAAIRTNSLSAADGVSSRHRRLNGSVRRGSSGRTRTPGRRFCGAVVSAIASPATTEPCRRAPALPEQVRGDAEIVQHLGNRAVVAGAVPMAGYGYTLTVQMVSGERAYPSERMARPHERDPCLGAQVDLLRSPDEKGAGASSASRRPLRRSRHNVPP